MPKKSKEAAIIKYISDTNDVYGENLKKLLAENLPFCCVCQKIQLPPYSKKCYKCKVEYFFCKKCRHDIDYIVPTECIFCIRKKNDAIFKIFSKLDSDLQDSSIVRDIYYEKRLLQRSKS